jgi:hypothetical protein
MDPNLYQQRPPIDLTNPRLHKLAVALGPACVRVSGTWANTAYFHNSDEPAPKTPPKGFGGVLTRRQWKGVIDFAPAVDAKLITSFAIRSGTRNSAGVWTPDHRNWLPSGGFPTPFHDRLDQKPLSHKPLKTLRSIRDPLRVERFRDRYGRVTK